MISYNKIMHKEKKIGTYGYIWLYKKSHPMSNKSGYVLEHRYIMSQHLNRILNSNEIVHHVNEKRTDNRIENFQLMSDFEHKSFHGKKHSNLKYQFNKTCISCGKKFVGGGNAKYCTQCKTKECKYCSKKFISDPAQKRKYCCKECCTKDQIGKMPKNTEGLKLGRGWWKGKSRYNVPSGKEHWCYIKRPTLTCEWCGKKYKTIRKRKTRRFCSTKCRLEWSSWRMKTNNPSKK